MTKLDEIDKEAGDCQDNGDAERWMKDYAALLIRAMRQLGEERAAYQKLFEAVDNQWKKIGGLFPEVYEAYNNTTSTPEPEGDVLELIANDKRT